ncbi:hypothetical protein RDI58_011073 [Solanum bulbocastanum]|uniref:Uncharacterized protein n=1 Tax=Solanum bulbocastanum TaxID=147425 RepID=A0AAN8TVL7_SOLBU
MLDDQLNTLSVSLKILRESMKELQANNKRMLSSICHVQSLLQEEMRLDSTFTDTPEISDEKTITSVLESPCNDNDTEIADTVKSQLDSSFLFLMLDIKSKSTSLPLFCPVLLLPLPRLNFLVCPSQLKNRHFQLKATDISLTWSFTARCSIKCGIEIFLQNFLALIQLLVRLVYTFVIGLIPGSYSKGFPLLSVDDASDVCNVSSVTTTHKVFADMSGSYTLLLLSHTATIILL